MRIIVFLLLVLLLLTGSTQVFNQRVDTLGSSVIEEKQDMSIFLSLLPSSALGDISAVCSSYSDLECTMEGTTITMVVHVQPDNAYYTLKTDHGFPFSSTTLTLNNIPTDAFDSRINEVLAKAGLSSGKSSSSSIDLNDVEGNRAKADAFQASDISIEYNIMMPNGQVSKYDLVALLSDSKPIVIQTYELNIWLFILILGIGALGYLAYSFFGKKRR